MIHWAFSEKARMGKIRNIWKIIFFISIYTSPVFMKSRSYILFLVDKSVT